MTAIIPATVDTYWAGEDTDSSQLEDCNTVHVTCELHTVKAALWRVWQILSQKYAYNERSDDQDTPTAITML